LNPKNQTNLGFTVIELLVVIAILGLFSSIIFSFSSIVRAKGRDAKRISDITNIITALGLEYATNGRFPCHSMSDVSAYFDPNHPFLYPLTRDGYFSTIPRDPKNVDPFIYGYGTYNSADTFNSGSPNPSPSTCGKSAFLWFTTERPISECPAGGLLIGTNHCHIFIYAPPDCNLGDSIGGVKGADLCIYADIYDEY
jgi:prepilin-type N-terminal cleavage/methylation domain-containing protein